MNKETIRDLRGRLLTPDPLGPVGTTTPTPEGRPTGPLGVYRETSRGYTERHLRGTTLKGCGGTTECPQGG